MSKTISLPSGANVTRASNGLGRGFRWELHTQQGPPVVLTAMDIAHLHDFAHDVEPISSMQWKCTADGFVDADGREPEELDDRELAYRTAETLGHLPDRLAAALAIELRRRVDKRGA